jgi:hypothetical protein
MTNSSASEKSKGVVLFAFNTPTVDYVEIAKRAAQLIKHNLRLPVTLITDNPVTVNGFDSVVCIENTLHNVRLGFAGGTVWRNGNRYSAYDLSPYDETLLIDTDYLVMDSNILKLFDAVTDYAIMRDNRYLNTPSANKMGPLSLSYLWATVILFKKTEKAKQLFALAGRVQRNYGYYRKLYQITSSNFRNDFAFTIANHVLNGYTEHNTLPWSMLTIEDHVASIEASKSMLVVRDSNRAYVVPKQNMHVMDKDYLLSATHKSFIDSICQD